MVRPSSDQRQNAVRGPRYKSSVACQNCRRRKVRCSYTITGRPCVHCRQDKVACVVGDGQRGSSQTASGLSTGGERVADNQYSSPAISSAIHSPDQDRARESNSSLRTRSSSATEPNHSALSHIVGDSPPFDSDSPFFIGGPHASVNIFDVVKPGNEAVTRYLLSESSPPSLAQDDIDYLSSKGVFSLPPTSVCHDLLRLYFRYIHPVMPVVDAHAVIAACHGTELHKISLLLLWSVFSVSASFAPTELRTLAGFSSATEMTESYFLRAKYLFHSGFEQDQFTCLQSSLLLSLSQPLTGMQLQPWYWSGVAITYCQSMGIYREFNINMNPRKRRLWRRIFWICLFRDRWLALILGRPFRIQLEDCDISFPSPEDFLCDYDLLPQQGKVDFMPKDFSHLASCWVRTIELSYLLGKILALSCRSDGPITHVGQVMELDADLQRLRFDIAESYQTPDEEFYVYHYQLHYQAVCITLYRPYRLQPPRGMEPHQKSEWQTTWTRKVDDAASETNNILNRLVRSKLLDYVTPFTPALVLPAMHAHLLLAVVADPLTKELSLNKLNFCMTILNELQSKYRTALVFREIFAETLQQILSTRTPAGTHTHPSLDQTVPANEGSSAGDSVAVSIDNLVTDASLFHYWDLNLTPGQLDMSILDPSNVPISE